VLQYRTKLSDLLSYDWVGIPLVYTQVVNLATLVYFFIGLFSYQYIGTNRFPQEPQLEQVRLLVDVVCARDAREGIWGVQKSVTPYGVEPSTSWSTVQHVGSELHPR
jgi:hypothetical protein